MRTAADADTLELSVEGKTAADETVLVAEKLDSTTLRTTDESADVDEATADDAAADDTTAESVLELLDNGASGVMNAAGPVAEVEISSRGSSAGSNSDSTGCRRPIR